jgi:uncharacterized protein (TIGR03437 family)
MAGLGHAQGVITTAAGTDWVFRDDGRPAASASLGGVWGVATDTAGNVFVADIESRLVVKFSPGGTLTVVAGNGLYDYSGDGGPATSASLAEPRDVAVDAIGNVYIADSGNSRIRKVTPNGVISTVAGNGDFAFSGDGGQAAEAALHYPQGVAVDSAGNLYISDTVNNRIRKVTAAGVITTVAGTGEAGFSGDGGPATAARLSQPGGVATDAGGNLYIADGDNGRIRKVTPAGIITTVAGGGDTVGDGGPATAAGLNSPTDIAVDAAGNLYIGDHFNQRIRKVSFLGTITTLAGTGELGFSGDGGPAAAARLNDPAGVTVTSAGDVYFTDSRNRRIRRVNANGIIATVAGSGNFKFSGDGGPATSAALNLPSSVAVDALGNLYIADTANHRVRKVTTSGVITTVAGNGTAGFSGDGGPATAASLNAPYSVAVDGNGNIYIADTDNQRVRKVSPSGTITTIAGGGENPGDGIPATSAQLDSPEGVAVDSPGNVYIATGTQVRKVSFAGTISTLAGTGEEGYSGDGGPATSARLNLAWGVDVDASGNVYIADLQNHRIRKVNSGGTITTVAGNGVEGYSGDGGPATNASLNFPYGVTVDAGGNLFIADSYNSVIRRVNSSGVISTVAGGGEESGDGRPATQVVLDFILDAAVDGAGNLYIADQGSERIRKVLAAAPTLAVAPTTLSFSVPAGTQRLDSQQIAISSNALGLLWSAQESTESGGGWLALAPASGFAPGSLSVFVNAAGLAPGSYRGTVRIQAPVATPASRTVTIDLTVTAASAPQLAVEPSSLSFQTGAGQSAPPPQTLRIRNVGGGTLTWAARAGTRAGGDWLSVAPSSGSVSSGAAASPQVSVNVTGLANGVYNGSIDITSETTGQRQSVPVTLLVTEVSQVLLVSRRGLLFTGVEGGANVPSQSFAVINLGQNTLAWTAQASTLDGGGWISVSPGSGQSAGNSLEVPEAEVHVNVTGLRAGSYSGVVEVRAPGARNSPQFVTVSLSVLPPGSNPGVQVRPAGLIFAAHAGGPSPGSQRVRLGTAGRESIEAVSGLLTRDGVNWIEVAPRNLAITPSDAGTVTVQASLGTLQPGVYRGAMTLLFSDGSPTQVVDILFLIVRSPAPAALAREGSRMADDGFVPLQTGDSCAPQQLLAVQRSLGTNFASPVGWPTLVEVQLIDDCGNAVTDASVVASFSNGDPPLVLQSIANGIYVGTWNPVGSTAQVTVTLHAERPPLPGVQVQALGQVRDNPAAPLLFAGGVVNGASFAPGEAVAPGSIVSVFGRRFAEGLNLAAQLPLETQLGGARLSIGGKDAPLFFSSDGQINAQIPFEVSADSQPQVVVRTNPGGGAAAIAVPETITLARERPGIFTTRQDGTGQGAILNQNSTPNAATNAAARGSVIQIFATGLGATNPVVASGQPAPGDPPALVATAVEARVGGQPAAVQFAGLAPGFVGLYQVNVVVPVNIEPGPAVELSLVQNGVPSNPVTVAVQ